MLVTLLLQIKSTHCESQTKPQPSLCHLLSIVQFRNYLCMVLKYDTSKVPLGIFATLSLVQPHLIIQLASVVTTFISNLED